MAKKKRGVPAPQTTQPDVGARPLSRQSDGKKISGGKPPVRTKKQRGAGPPTALPSVSAPPATDKPKAAVPMADLMSGKAKLEDLPGPSPETREAMERLKRQAEIRGEITALLEQRAVDILVEEINVLMRLRTALMGRSGNSRRLLVLFESGIIDELLLLEHPERLDLNKLRSMLKMLLD